MTEIVGNLVVDNLLHEHVELSHVLDLTVYLVY